MCGEYVALNWYSKEGENSSLQRQRCDVSNKKREKKYFEKNDKFNLLCEIRCFPSTQRDKRPMSCGDE